MVLTKGYYVVAVSGGVDSVVLLDMLQRVSGIHLVVAHFDHGIREDSAEDAEFVKELARSYDLPFEMRREELGRGTSEEKARQRRYAFLREVAKKHNAKLVTAHHTDDVVETIAINHIRGTGWRGLAVLDSDIARPLLGLTKQTLKDYATKHHLQWREDSTNTSDAYLRNRLRPKAAVLSDEEKRQLLALRAHQVALKKEIDQEVKNLAGNGPLYKRYFFIHAHTKPAVEILRHLTKQRLTRPQLDRALLAIKTARNQSIYQAGDGIEFRFTPRHFAVELIK